MTVCPGRHLTPSKLDNGTGALFGAQWPHHVHHEDHHDRDRDNRHDQYLHTSKHMSICVPKTLAAKSGLDTIQNNILPKYRGFGPYMANILGKRSIIFGLHIPK